VGQRLHHICTHCGDKMRLDTVTRLFYCSHCGHTNERTQKTKIKDAG
jgi:DNA-directed RNA polymerase subunit RPC12/RpoP